LSGLSAGASMFHSIIFSRLSMIHHSSSLCFWLSGIGFCLQVYITLRVEYLSQSTATIMDQYQLLGN